MEPKANISHIDNLNTLEKLESFGFSGIDVSLEISLFDYGLVWKKLKNGDFLFIYSIGEKQWDRITVNPSNFIESDLDWISNEHWNGFLRTNGYSEKRVFDERDFGYKIFDLIQYFGYEEIFGFSYWEGFQIYSLEQVQELWEEFASIEISDSNGIYIPKIFVEQFLSTSGENKWNSLVPVGFHADFAICSKGPETDFYWEAWEEIIQNFQFTDSIGRTFSLHQNGDLFLVDAEFHEKTKDFPEDILEQFWQW